MKKIAVSFFAFLGALLLGGLGNGVWQYILHPGLSWLAHFALDIATLGVSTFKDTMYAEVAKGLHEKASLTLLVGFLAIGSTLYLIILFAGWLVTKQFRKRLEGIQTKINQFESGTKLSSISHNTQHDELTHDLAQLKTLQSELKSKVTKLARLGQIMMIFAAAVFAYAMVGSEREQYINSAITNFSQSLAICAPDTTPQEVEKLKGQFAAINSKADYVSLIDAVKARCDIEHARQLPKFEPW